MHAGTASVWTTAPRPHLGIPRVQGQAGPQELEGPQVVLQVQVQQAKLGQHGGAVRAELQRFLQDAHRVSKVTLHSLGVGHGQECALVALDAVGVLEGSHGLVVTPEVHQAHALSMVHLPVLITVRQGQNVPVHIHCGLVLAHEVPARMRHAQAAHRQRAGVSAFQAHTVTEPPASNARGSWGSGSSQLGRAAWTLGFPLAGARRGLCRAWQAECPAAAWPAWPAPAHL